MKSIKELQKLVSGAILRGNEEIFIEHIECDSRKVENGTLFVCIVGSRVDGHNFIGEAIASGACAILTTRADVLPPEGGAVLQVPDIREALSIMVPYFYNYPARAMRVIGITGTNGKTTTSYLLRKILMEVGYRVGLVGTINILIDEQVFHTNNTTPDVICLQQILAQMRDNGIDYVVMEVSSHALAQNRIAGIEFDTAVFTNLTQDHLDYHKTLENYQLAKAKLFDILSQKGIKKRKTAIINADDSSSKIMLKHTKCKKLTFGIDTASDLQATDIKVKINGANVIFNLSSGERVSLNLLLTGIFNVYNVMGAFLAALAEKVEVSVIKRALEKFTGVPGRFELVYSEYHNRQDFAVIVDYAHTPDGVENVLKTARKITQGRLIVVFGCGGDRDTTKRPLMGKIAGRLADVVVVTSDNPRSEEPEKIIQQVVTGVKKTIKDKPYEEIVDRRQAIFRAIELARSNDIVLILGKGHEDYQILRDKIIHFDDKEVAREVLKEKFS